MNSYMMILDRRTGWRECTWDCSYAREGIRTGRRAHYTREEAGTHSAEVGPALGRARRNQDGTQRVGKVMVVSSHSHRPHVVAGPPVLCREYDLRYPDGWIEDCE